MFTYKYSRTSLFSIAIALAVILAGTGPVQAQYIFGEPENLGPVVNTSTFEQGPELSPNGLELFFFSIRPEGMGGQDIYVATRASILDPWQPPVNLGSPVNTAYTDSQPSISADGLTLYFRSNRPGGLGSGADLWMATRASLTDPWESPVNLGEPVNTAEYGEFEPDISADGLTLYFSSGRPGGVGGRDIWMTTRASLTDSWQDPVNLGTAVNSPADDWGEGISPDGLTLLVNSHSDRGGLGGVDMWVSVRASLADPWQPAVNLGPLVNTPFDDGMPKFSDDGTILVFHSSRPCGSGARDLWQVALAPNACVDQNGACEPGEDCLSCTADCFAGESTGCGNGICELTLGEDCLSCPEDCNGQQSGNPANRFCCGCGVYYEVSCDDPRCTSDGFDCSLQPVLSSCCGDGVCEGAEDSANCAADCGAGCSGAGDCEDSDPCTIDDCVNTVCVNDPLDCDDGDACTEDSCSGGVCFNDPIDCDDGDACSVDTCHPISGCLNTFPDCGLMDGCCGPACDPGNDPDCPCGGQNEPCSVDEDCCSLYCRHNGKCAG